MRANKSGLVFWMLLLAVSGSACVGKRISVGGIDVYESVWRRTTSDIGRKASFELGCDAGQLKYTLLHRELREPTEVAVEGCGHRALYVRPIATVGGYMAIGQWQLSSLNQGERARPVASNGPSSSL
jgi:hypothetical protein